MSLSVLQPPFMPHHQMYATTSSTDLVAQYTFIPRLHANTSELTCTHSQGIELIMRYFVGTELGVANVIQRHFDVRTPCSPLRIMRTDAVRQWSANSLWYEEIPNATDPHKAAFFLGGEDAIVDATVSPSFSRPGKH